MPTRVRSARQRDATHRFSCHTEDLSITTRPCHDAPISVHGTKRQIIAELSYLRTMRPHRLRLASYNQADVLRSIKFGERGQHLIAQQSWLCDSVTANRLLNY